jgi:SpoIID/LytB domain protein
MGGTASPEPLRLAAAAGTLNLEDGAGARFQAPSFLFQWRWEPLGHPLTLRRQVAGPYASYETAEAVAQRWATAGVAVQIARPAEWEVWAPADAAPLAGVPSRLQAWTVSRRLVLDLQRPQGTVALRGPIRIQAPAGLRWKGGVYGGPFRLQSDAHGGWTLVEEVGLERYLEGVVPHEIGAGAPPAAQAAQAVLARTWAVRNRGRYQVDGYHLCADTQCQVYSDPGQVGGALRRAIAASRGQVLTSGGKPIHAVYHASNGGVAAGLEEAWDVAPVAYLRPFTDGEAAFVESFRLPLAQARLVPLLRGGQGAYGADHPLFRWQRRLTAQRIGQALAARGLAVGAPRSLKVLERGPSGRVLALEIGGSTGTVVLRRDGIRRSLRDLPSTLFQLTPAGPGAWMVEGGGFGHGAGLSQAGALDLARRGWSSQRILQHYYPGAALQPLGAIGAAAVTDLPAAAAP